MCGLRMCVSSDGRRSAAIFATIELPSVGAYHLVAPEAIPCFSHSFDNFLHEDDWSIELYAWQPPCQCRPLTAYSTVPFPLTLSDPWGHSPIVSLNPFQMRFMQHFTRYQLMSPKLHTKLMAVILGSIAMRMRYDCNFNNHFSANLQKNLPVQELWKSVNIRQSYDHEFGVQFFGPPCSVLCCPTTVVIDCCGGCILQIYYWLFGGMFLVTSSQWTKQC